ncbi:MAG: aromatic ring-hydroxylating dioxygenase subunit alpha [Acidobacteriota bacterium]
MSLQSPHESEEGLIAEDIHDAATLPGAFYGDESLWRRSLDRIFARTWQWIGDANQVRVPGQVHPVTLLPGSLNEPLLLTRDGQDHLHCLSNVCTHRGMLVCESPGVLRQLRCRYHGRRFDLAGRFRHMPEFEATRGFPSEADHLPQLPLKQWGKMLFTSLDPDFPFDLLIEDLERRLGSFPHHQLTHDPGRSRNYLVRAHWALYCDNYLEGFHIPFVHGALAQALDYDEYETELFPWGSLQLGIAAGAEETFELPADHPDAQRRLAAYYYFLFPNTMLNVYPWGISVNVVEPLAIDRTRVRFLTYVADPQRLDRGASADLDRVEREDEAVVEAVQRGVTSRLYQRGRFSPQREQGVHHFHRLLAHCLDL